MAISAVPNACVKSAPDDDEYGIATIGRGCAHVVNWRETVQVLRGNERLQSGIRRHANKGSFQLADSLRSGRT
jgi:hypothetical protein